MRKSCRRFINDQNIRIFHYDLGYLDKFPRLEIQCGHRHISADIRGPNCVQSKVRLSVHFLSVYDRAFAEFLYFCEKQVLSNRNAGYGSALLNDHAYALFQSINHADRRPRLAAEKHFAFVCFLHSCSDGRNGGFPRTVFSYQPADLSRECVKVDTVESDGARKALMYIFHLKDGSFHILTSCPIF